MVEVLTNLYFLAAVCAVMICVVPALSYYWWKVRKAELEASLKHEMIQRGMAADEIERVLQAGFEDDETPSKQRSKRQVVAKTTEVKG